MSKMIPPKPFRFLLSSSKEHAFFAWGAFSAVFLATVASDILPYVFKQIVDTAASASGDFSATRFWVYILIATIVFMYIAWRTSGFLGMRWLTRLNATAYKDLFAYLSLHSSSYFSNRFAGALTNKISHAADGSERLGDSLLWNAFPTVLGFFVSGFLMFVANTTVGFIFAGLIIVIVAVNLWLVQHRRPLVITYAAEGSALRGVAVDIASNINAVWQFARRPFELNFLGEQVHKRRDADIRQWQHSEFSLILNNVIITIAVGTIFLVMLASLESGNSTIGDFILVLTLMTEMLQRLTFIGNMMNNFIRVYGEIEEGLQEVLVPHELVDVPGAEELLVSNGEITFDTVDFSYQDNPVFANLVLSIPAKQKIGLVGASGAGKTTLVSLLLRQHDLNDGRIIIDGQDIAEVTQESLRRAIAVIPQDPLLFHRSIMDNIRYGNLEATDDQVIEAAKLAQAHEFITSAPEGYETFVGERGIKLSGGQRQRIAIARAILKNAPILVLDEATSSLDSESELYIQKALQELVKEKTVLAIAHRLSTIKEMDRIILLEEGDIAEDGSHDELVNAGGTYARLWSHQAGGFLQDEDI